MFLVSVLSLQKCNSKLLECLFDQKQEKTKLLPSHHIISVIYSTEAGNKFSRFKEIIKMASPAFEVLDLQVAVILLHYLTQCVSVSEASWVKSKVRGEGNGAGKPKCLCVCVCLWFCVSTGGSALCVWVYVWYNDCICVYVFQPHSDLITMWINLLVPLNETLLLTEAGSHSSQTREQWRVCVLVCLDQRKRGIVLDSRLQ